MNKKYVVRLEDQERARLEAVISRGRAAARTIQRAWILLKADVGPAGPGWSDAEIRRAFAVGPVTIDRAWLALVERRRFSSS